jgi:hypothetical protein
MPKRIPVRRSDYRYDLFGFICVQISDSQLSFFSKQSEVKLTIMYNATIIAQIVFSLLVQHPSAIASIIDFTQIGRKLDRA